MPFDALPTFNPSGGGPQGAPGIPPEQINAALGMVGQAPKPEESPEAIAVMDRQAGHVMAQLGITPEPSLDGAPAPAPVPDTPQYHPQAAPVPGVIPDTYQVGQPPAVPPDFAGRIANIQQKFGGDFDKLAASHVHAQRSMTQARQANAQQGGEIQDLQQSVAQLTATVHGAIQNLNQGGAYPERPTSTQGVPGGADPESFSRERYDEDPVGTIREVVNASMVENFRNYESARKQHDDQQVEQDRYREKESEYAQWRPRMTAIFNENPGFYKTMEPYTVMALLLERAKERQGLETAQVYHSQINAELGIQPPQQMGIPGQPGPGQVDPNGSPYPMNQGAPVPGTPPQVPPGYGPVPPGYGMSPPQPGQAAPALMPYGPGQVAPAPSPYGPGQVAPALMPYGQGQGAAMPGQPGFNIPVGPGSGGMRTAMPGQAPGGSWSKTPGMQHLWNAKSDSMDEMKAITDVLQERGFGNHLG